MTETEDVYFCRLLRAADRDIWVDHDLSSEVGHVGQYTFREGQSQFEPSQPYTPVPGAGGYANQ